MLETALRVTGRSEIYQRLGADAVCAGHPLVDDVRAFFHRQRALAVIRQAVSLGKVVVRKVWAAPSVHLLGRVRPGVTDAQAAADLGPISALVNNASTPVVGVTAVYEDVLRRTADGWRFVRRSYQYMWVDVTTPIPGQSIRVPEAAHRLV